MKAKRKRSPKQMRIRRPHRGDWWQFTTNNGVIDRFVKSVSSGGMISYTVQGRFFQCQMATWQRCWGRAAELMARDEW